MGGNEGSRERAKREEERVERARVREKERARRTARTNSDYTYSKNHEEDTHTTKRSTVPCHLENYHEHEEETAKASEPTENDPQDQPTKYRVWNADDYGSIWRWMA
mmetsp:Transcript_10691/g.12121  ORF Transcript_10691/g.12121 Transcript_10691/m.12121 type:complete len:106 (+) Transcript_10691:315-632(+)